MSTLSDYLDGPAGTNDTPGFVFLEAVVVQNANRDYPGMVKVEYAAFREGKNTSAWLPLLAPYAGKEHGALLKPEIGDTVLVGFLGTAMEKPFILGSLYPTGAKVPADHYQENNTTRHLKTKGGVSVTIQDENDKQSLELATPRGLRIRLEDEKETVSLCDANGKNKLTLDSKEGKLTLQSEKGLTLKVGGCELQLDSGGKLTVKCAQLELKADQSASLSAGTTLALEGAVAKLEGKQTASLKGNTMAEVSGGILKLN